MQNFCKRGHLKLPENTFGKNQCKSCHKLAVANYEKTAACKKYRAEWAKTPIRKQYEAEYYAEHRQNWKDWHLKRKYNLSVEQRKDLEDRQNGKCAVCGILGKNTPKGLVVDHDHKTNKIRGLLCNVCNSHIVHVVEMYPDLLNKAKSYLGGL